MRNRIGIDEHFITVVGDDGTAIKDGFGGNQNWLNPQISGWACGVVAAVNIGLYLTGQREISQTAYIEKCKEFCKKHPLNVLLIKLKIGAVPSTLGRYIQFICKNCKNAHVKTRWNWKKGMDQYDTMKYMLAHDLPVLWGIYALQVKPHKEKRQLSFYKYKDNQYLPTAYKVCSHYVVATALYEDVQDDGLRRRMVEVSSWGQRFYVDYDEYLVFSDVCNVPKHVGEKAVHLINSIGSNVLKIEC